MKISRKWKRLWHRDEPSFMKSIAKPAAIAAIAAGVLLSSPSAYALPTDGQITVGAGTIAASGAKMTVTQQTGKMAVNWQSFNITNGEKVQFVQPSASSVVLNRVVGNNSSAIYGQLSANGRVILVNQNGVYFSPTSRVDTGALVASTLNITDSDFAAGNYRFAKGTTSGRVLNQGQLTATEGGYVALLGESAVNEGIIIANKGTVALGSGEKATLDMTGDGLINLAVDQGTMNAQAANKGLIQADGGLVVMTARSAGNLAGTVVNNSGVIRANTLSVQNGRIVLDGGSGGAMSTGTLDASGLAAGQTGGTVKVLGDSVTLGTGSKITVSGDTGGGTVLVGGNYQGKGPEQNAANTTVEAGTTIHADAVTTGNGGKVVVWADGSTKFAGTISAKGGSLSGDGGSMETSGKQSLKIADTAQVNTLAHNGKIGTWLLDPKDFTIAANGGDMTGTALSNSLSSTNMEIVSSNGGTDGSGNINVNDSVTWSANTALTLTASADININADITAAGNTSGLVLSYGAGNKYSLNNGARVTLSGATPSLTIGGQAYTVINKLDVLQSVKEGLSGRYALGKDLDASATSGWNSGAGFLPIGRDGYPFTGNFDGLGHVVSNLYISSNLRMVGLFGYSQGLIKDIGLVGLNVTCTSDSYPLIGGLVGINDGGTITNAYSQGTVSATGSGGGEIGGLVGNNSGTITNSYSTANVTATDATAGGLLGYNMGTVTNAYSTGNVTISIGHAGGLAGQNASGLIKNAYSTGSVKSESTAYGSVGGLVGENNPATIEHAYSTGKVEGGKYTGGFVGHSVGWASSYSVIENSYWDKGTSGQNDGVGSFYNTTITNLTGLSTDDAFSKAKYSQFDFNNTNGTWYMIDGYTRPFLRSEYSTTITNAHQLQLIGMNNTTISTNYTLANNIDMSELQRASGMWQTSTGFVPIRYINMTETEKPFSGTFDGQGYTIDNLKIANPTNAYNVGLFSIIDGATIKNVGLKNVDITTSTSTNSTGALVGQILDGTITNSYSTGTVTSDVEEGYVGGLVGDFQKGTINNSYSKTKVTGSTSSMAGGLVGRALTDATISNSYSDQSDPGYQVSSEDGWAGGLVGFNVGTIRDSYSIASVLVTPGEYAYAGGLVADNQGTIESSYSKGTVLVEEGFAEGDAGGLVGRNSGTGTVLKSYSMATVTVKGNYELAAGGLVGYNLNFATIKNSYSTGSVAAQGEIIYAGGLVGYNKGVIENAYSIGSVTADSISQGGLVGFNNATDDKISNSYWDTEKSGLITSAGGTGRSTVEMQKVAAAFDSKWDTSIWRFSTSDYPRFVWEPSSAATVNITISPATITYGSGIPAYTYVLKDEAGNLLNISDCFTSAPAINSNYRLGYRPGNYVISVADRNNLPWKTGYQLGSVTDGTLTVNVNRSIESAITHADTHATGQSSGRNSESTLPVQQSPASDGSGSSPVIPGVEVQNGGIALSPVTQSLPDNGNRLNIAAIGNLTGGYSLTVSNQAVTVTLPDANSTTAATGQVTVIGVGAQGRPTVVNTYSIVSTGGSLTVTSAAAGTASGIPVAAIPADNAANAKVTTFKLGTTDGNTAEFSVIYADNAISIKPFNNAAAEFSRHTGGDLRVLIATSLATAQQSFGIASDTISAVYVSQQ